MYERKVRINLIFARWPAKYTIFAPLHPRRDARNAIPAGCRRRRSPICWPRQVDRSPSVTRDSIARLLVHRASIAPVFRPPGSSATSFFWLPGFTATGLETFSNTVKPRLYQARLYHVKWAKLGWISTCSAIASGVSQLRLALARSGLLITQEVG